MTLSEIKQLQKGNLNVDLVKLVIDLQCRIIINCSVGIGKADTKIPYELESGQVVELPIQDSMTNLVMGTLKRPMLPINLLFPELLWWCISPADRLYRRNVVRLRQVLSKMI